MTVSDLTERDLIARIRCRLPPPPDWMQVGPGDDAAVVECERNRLEILSVDALVEGVHFDRAFVPPDAIGHRALAVNLSDLAAMGAQPRLALLSMALPPELPLADFDAIANGFTALAAASGIHLAGGNLTRSTGPLMIDVTVTGTAKPRRVLVRSGARPGDDVYVSGTIGSAGVGLQMLRRNLSAGPDPEGQPGLAACVRRYLYPEPRVRLGLLLARNRAASACMDLSDGLADAAVQVSAASGVGMVLDEDLMPIEPAVREWLGSEADTVGQAVTAGDDYELLFTVGRRSAGRLRAAARHGRVALTRIGVCTDRRGEVTLRRGAVERPMPAAGFSHFR